jgi:hypothetical protein
MTVQEHLKNVVYFIYWGSMIKNDASYTYEIKARIAMEKAAFSKKKPVLTSKLDINLCKK